MVVVDDSDKVLSLIPKSWLTTVADTNSQAKGRPIVRPSDNDDGDENDDANMIPHG